MYEHDELKRRVKAWAKKRGKHSARLKLINEGVGYSTANLLINGEYHSDPKDRLVEILNRCVRRK